MREWLLFNHFNEAVIFHRLTLTEEQLSQLLDGFDLNGMRPHYAVHFQSEM